MSDHDKQLLQLRRRCRRLERIVAELDHVLSETNKTLGQLANHTLVQRDLIDDLLTREDPADWWRDGPKEEN